MKAIQILAVKNLNYIRIFVNLADLQQYIWYKLTYTLETVFVSEVK